MSEPTKHRLAGLEPDNILAFFALLGLLRALETALQSQTWHPRISWDIEHPPLRPTLVLSETRTAEEICDAAAEGAHMLSKLYVFPSEKANENGEYQKDLNYSMLWAHTFLEETTQQPDRTHADLLAALMCDAAGKDGQVEATPFCLLFGQGHQHFLDRLASVPRTETPPPRGRGKNTVTLTPAQTLHETLFLPWKRQDPTFAFRWDPTEDVRYALRADDPSSVKSTTQHGANRLAALGLSVLTVAPKQRGNRVRLQVVGGNFDREGFSFAWPIWSDAASLATIRALLSHPSLGKQSSNLKYLGVKEVYRTRRISVGKFMNFTRAEPTMSIHSQEPTYS